MIAWGVNPRNVSKYIENPEGVTQSQTNGVTPSGFIGFFSCYLGLTPQAI